MFTLPCTYTRTRTSTWDRGTRYATVTGPLRRALRWKKEAACPGAFGDRVRLLLGELKGCFIRAKGRVEGQELGVAWRAKKRIDGLCGTVRGPQKNLVRVRVTTRNVRVTEK